MHIIFFLYIPSISRDPKQVSHLGASTLHTAYGTGRLLPMGQRNRGRDIREALRSVYEKTKLLYLTVSKAPLTTTNEKQQCSFKKEERRWLSGENCHNLHLHTIMPSTPRSVQHQCGLGHFIQKLKICWFLYLTSRSPIRSSKPNPY